MKDRIKSIRKHLGFTQVEFGKRIGVKGNTVTQYETGRNPPSDTVIALLCREYNVNEHWLRTGEGEMFIEHTLSDEISAFMGDLLSGPEDFKSRFIVALSKLGREDWLLLEKIATNLMTETKNPAE